MKDEGRAVLLATHDMAEAERLCDRIAVIAQRPDRRDRRAARSDRRVRRHAWKT